MGTLRFPCTVPALALLSSCPPISLSLLYPPRPLPTIPPPLPLPPLDTSFFTMATSGPNQPPLGSSSVSAPQQPIPNPSNSDQITWDGDKMYASLSHPTRISPHVSHVPSLSLSDLARVPLPSPGSTSTYSTTAKSEVITRLLASLSPRPTSPRNLNLPSTLSKVFFSSSSPPLLVVPPHLDVA